MRNVLICFAVVFSCLIATVTRAGSTAHARLFCLSLRFQRAVTHDSYGFQYRLDLTTLQVGVNGELAPDFFGSGYDQSAYIELYSEWYDETDKSGAIALNLPDAGDADNDGFNDFWDISKGFTNLNSVGVLQTSFLSGSANAKARWTRDAGSDTGLCSITVPDPSNPVNSITFNHTFQLLEYNGTLTYTPGVTNVTGSVNLTQKGGPDATNTFVGPVDFVKSSTNRFNELTLQPGAWTNAAGQNMPFLDNLYTRDPQWPTNYYGYFDFEDGDLTTTDADYFTWILSIDDTNDSNTNGIPDFSDDVQSVVGNGPLLSLSVGATNVLLTITGDVGHDYTIQEKTSLSAANWTDVKTVSLTNSPQAISLPRTADRTKFWRAVVQ